MNGLNVTGLVRGVVLHCVSAGCGDPYGPGIDAPCTTIDAIQGLVHSRKGISRGQRERRRALVLPSAQVPGQLYRGRRKNRIYDGGGISGIPLRLCPVADLLTLGEELVRPIPGGLEHYGAGNKGTERLCRRGILDPVTSAIYPVPQIDPVHGETKRIIIHKRHRE